MNYLIHYFATNWLELFGFISGLACVYLNAKENIWGWPIAMLSVSLYGMVFFNSKLYADASLQVFFFIISSYGLYNWLRFNNKNEPLKISYSQPLEIVFYSLFALGLLGLIYLVLTTYTNSDLPFFDALTTSLSIVAQLLLTKKKIENWIFWFVANIFYIGIYLFKDLYLTAFLYFLFLLLSVFGYFEWKKNGNQMSPNPIKFN